MSGVHSLAGWSEPCFGKIPVLEQGNRAAAPILSEHPPLYPANAGKFQ
jgi:hypothetical protein